MLRLIKFPICTESVAVLRVLLRSALRGELRGFSLCCRQASGTDEVILAGVYREHPQLAFIAAARIQRAATQQMDLFV